MFIWLTDPDIYRRLYADSLVGCLMSIRPGAEARPIVDYKEDGGGLGLYLIVNQMKRNGVHPSREPDGGSWMEVYHPYPEPLLKDRGEVWPVRTVHSIFRPSSSQPIDARHRTVTRAEPPPR